MKKLYFILLSVFSGFLAHAQIITTNPAIITRDYTGVIEVIYDASQGNKALINTTGDVYAHTGVLTTASASSGDWKHAPTWLDNASKYKLTALGSNKFKLLITPNMKLYYSLLDSEVVTHLAFVFRNSTGTLQGKTSDGADILTPVLAPGLNVAFQTPSSDLVLAPNTTLAVSIVTNQASDISFSVNGTTVAQNTSTTALSYSYLIPGYGDYTLVAKAVSGSNSASDTLYLCSPTAPATAARPAGILDGITYSADNTSATLVLYAPNKNNVFLLGDFNDWRQQNSYQLKKDGNYWWMTVSGLTPGKEYAFQYVVDGTIRISDPYAEKVLDPWNDKWISNCTYPNLQPYPIGKTDGLVGVLQPGKAKYNWNITDFKIASKENLIIYELLLRDFTPEKSLAATLEKLDYLKTLGVNAIELMPITEFDGNDSWGYNPNHFFASDKAYGTEEMYKYFIDECHKKGIAVIVDMVFNHATGSHPFAKLYWNAATNKTSVDNPWFNVDAPHPWSVFHDFNHEFAGTREHFKRCLKFWLEEYKIDGYRMDLTKGFSQKVTSDGSQYDATRIAIIKDYYNTVKAVNPDAIFILEHFCVNSEESELANAGMYLWRNNNNAYCQAAMGYQSDSSFEGMITSPRNWVGFAESHDEERTQYKVKTWGKGDLKAEEAARLKRVPLVMAFDVLLPGPKMIWQFQEMGFDVSINQKIVNGVVITPPTGSDYRTDPKPVDWGYLDIATRKAAYDMCANLISLRTTYPQVFTEGEFSIQIGGSNWANGRRIEIKHADLNVVVLGNFSAEGNVTAYPNLPWNGPYYTFGSTRPTFIAGQNAPISITPGHLLVLFDRPVTLNTEINTPTTEEVIEIYPTITRDQLFFGNTIAEHVTIFTLQGKVVKESSHVSSIGVSDLSAGVYLIRLEREKGVITEKFIKQ